MAKFHGPVNLHLGADEKDGEAVPAWAQSTWDPESGSYVVEVSGGDVKKFRAAADEYGFVQDGKGDESADEKADKDA